MKTRKTKPLRFTSLPEDIRRDLKAARLKQGWSQLEVGQRVGLPQMHISGIETGKIVPRFSTLLDLARTLGYDFLMVPRALVPAAQALIRDSKYPDRAQQPLYANFDDNNDELEEHDPHDEV